MTPGGAVVWVTGLPGSGKSTFAQRLRDRLGRAGVPTILLDGDEVRAALVPPPGYGPAEREAFYGTLGNLALLFAGQGAVAIVAATAHRRAFRDRIREGVPRFVEVFVDVPLEVCMTRDPKGLYARARAGGAPELPGAAREYEPPLAPEVVSRGGEDEGAVEKVLDRLGPARRPASGR